MIKLISRFPILPVLVLFGAAEMTCLHAQSPSNQESSRIEELRQEIHRHDELYFLEATPEISDHEYDLLTRKLKDLESQSAEDAVWPNTASNGIGDDRMSGNEKSLHSTPMQSLDKCYSQEDLETWLGKVLNDADKTDLTLSVEPKVDGLAVSLVYEKGRFVRALTRGNGREGDDITASVLAIGGIPLNLPGDGKSATSSCRKIELRGEIYMPLSRFEEINQARHENGSDSFKTPRNLAAGSIRFDDLEAVRGRGLAIVLFSWGSWEPLSDEPHTQSAFVDRADRWGLPVLQPLDRVVLRNGKIPQLPLEMYLKQLSAMDMPTDGLVLKLDEVSLRRKLGTGSRSPNWAVAYKFEPESAMTTVKAIRFNVGRTGRLAPVAELEPVEINGRSVSRTSLHNLDAIKQMDLREGDHVKVILQGDVIPLISTVFTEQRDSGSNPFMRPTNCPGCGGKLPTSGRLRCGNPDCPERRIKQLLYFAKSVGIRGIAEPEVRTQYRSGQLKDFSDFAGLWNPGQVPAWKILQGLCIEGMGPVSCRRLMGKVDSLQDLIQIKDQPFDFLQVGLTQAQVLSMKRFLENEANLLMLKQIMSTQEKEVSSASQ